MARTIMALVLLATLGSAWAQSDFERFQLYTDCQALSLYVTVQQEDGDELQGLTESAVRNAVESRLRSARLYTEEVVSPALNVSVQIASWAFHIRLFVEKSVVDVASFETNYAATWVRSSTGTHGTEASYVLSSLSAHMDAFLVEYLRVNDEACESQ